MPFGDSNINNVINKIAKGAGILTVTGKNPDDASKSKNFVDKILDKVNVSGGVNVSGSVNASVGNPQTFSPVMIVVALLLIFTLFNKK